jgi:hypothetical protein
MAATRMLARRLPSASPIHRGATVRRITPITPTTSDGGLEAGPGALGTGIGDVGRLALSRPDDQAGDNDMMICIGIPL